MSHHHKPKRAKVGCLPRWQRNSTHLFFAVCALSGIGYLLAHTLRWDSLAEYAHTLLVSHGISAYLSVLAFGAVMPGHIRSAWNVRRNRMSGVVMIAVLVALMGSGLLLYYGSEEMHDTVLWVHWIVGGLSVAAFPYHLIAGRLANLRATEKMARMQSATAQEAPRHLHYSLPSSSTTGSRAASIS